MEIRDEQVFQNVGNAVERIKSGRIPGFLGAPGRIHE
jgi:hypothetical protein